MYGLIRAELRAGASGVPHLLERGQLRLLGPRTDVGIPAYTLVNTSGAVLGTDRLRVDITVGEARAGQFGTVGATLLHSGKPSLARTRLRVAAGGHLEWLPGPLLPMAGSHHRQHTIIEVAVGGTLLATDILQVGPLCGPNAAPTCLAVATSAVYANCVVYRERAAYASGNAQQWGEFRCLGTLLALGELFDPATADALSANWQRRGLWGGFSALAGGGISGKLLTVHPQDCREAIAAAVDELRERSGAAFLVSSWKGPSTLAWRPA